MVCRNIRRDNRQRLKPNERVSFRPDHNLLLPVRPKSASLPGGLAEKDSIMARFFALPILLAVTVILPAPALAKQCKEKPVKAISTAVNPVAVVVSASTARSLAREAWDKRCDQIYPGIWCDRSMAAGPKYTCNRAPNGLGGYKHVCEFSATPCRN
jgi:hypothetical protein